MALDLEEQEQLDALKAWWHQNGKWVVAGVSAFVIVVGGIQGWNVWKHRQASGAAQLFEQATQAMENGNAKGVKEITSQIMENYGNTAYATSAAWLAGRANLDAGDLKSAQAQYAYALEHAKDPGLEQIARLRLAAVLLDQKDYPGALKLLESKHDAAFAGLYANLKGDVLAAQGQAAEARAAYTLALEKLGEKSPMKPLVEIKLDGLGG